MGLVDDLGEQIADRYAGLERMPQGDGEIDRITIAAAVLLSAKDSPLLEFGHDSLHRPLGDSHECGDIPQSHLGIAKETHQHVGVVREECPTNIGQSGAHS